MSLLDSFTKKKTLNTAIAQVAKARSNEGKTAEQMFKSAYRDFAEALVGDALRADILYNWGFALLHHAKTETDEKKAADLYDEAISKFTFCLLLNPSYLGAAINGGVAYMDLARLIAADADDGLYECAKEFFTKANNIQAGSASYNLACIYGLHNDGEACLNALENAKARGFLPDAADILDDVDLDHVKTQTWFVEFIASLEASSETVEQVADNSEKTELVEQTPSEQVAEQDTVAVSEERVEQDKTESKE